MLLTETIKYYMDNHSSVYVCMLDASKAFDRVEYCKLFDILLERNIPHSVSRLLLDLYTRQTITASWNRKTSACFSAKNGVRQGAILSPILFSLYMDELVKDIKSKSIGCYMGNHFVGAIAYADDLVLLCPSIKGLSCMISCAVQFAHKYHLIFNAKKSLGIKFNKNGKLYDGYDVFIENSILHWKTSAKYLGTVLTSNLDHAQDIISKTCAFNHSANGIINKFKGTTNQVTTALVSKYCYSFYGCQNWDLGNNETKPLTVQWNKMVRRIYGLPYKCHSNILPIVIGHNSPQVMFAQRFINYFSSMCNSENEIVNYFAQCAQNYQQGQLGINLKTVFYLYYKKHNIEFNIDVMCKLRKSVVTDTVDVN